MERTINDACMTQILCTVMTEVLYSKEHESDEKYLERVDHTFNKMCDIIIARMSK